jgi:hypothetical protein
VISVNPDGTYVAVLADGTLITLVVPETDTATVKKLNNALETLLVYWTVDALGNRVPVSDQIAALHDQGYGFGVLVKLFAISKASGGTVTVEYLLAQVQSGVGMGQLFKSYGKPPEVGVGHVRQQLKNQETQETGNGWEKHQNPNNGNQPPGQDKKENKPPKDKGNKVKGVCKSVSKGNGKGAGNNCP